MSSEKVRTAIVGCGKIAVTHAGALRALEESDFVACCDTDEGRASAMAEEYGVPHVFTDARELFTSGLIDAALICAPHPAHCPLVTMAAEAGVHVLCEKPISVSLAEADQMVEAAEKAGVTFGVIFQRRFWPSAQRIRRAIDDGKLGKLTLGECSVRIWRPESYFASDTWRGKWATEGGGVLMNQAVHAIDQFQWFMGPAVEVVGRYATLRHGDYIDVEDTAVATVVFANGALGTIQAASTFDPGFGFRVAVHGDAGTAVSVWENPEGRQGINDVWTIPGEEEQRLVWEQAEDNRPGFPEFHALQIQDFLQALLEKRQPAVTGAEGRKSLEIILAIYESSRTGRPIPLPMSA
jgi:predicted dehydrogenase